MKAYPAYKDSGVEWLGNIPEHWEMKRLKFVAPIINAKLDDKPDEMPYFALEHIESNTGRLINNEGQQTVESSVSVFRKGDVLFGKLRPYLNKVVHVQSDGTCSSELVVFRAPANASSRYLFYVMLSKGFVDTVNAVAYGVKMPRATPEQIGNMRVSVLSLPEQETIAEFLDERTNRIDKLVAKKERLIELLKEKRTAIIFHAVTKGLDPNAKMKDFGIDWLGKIPEHWGVKRLRHIIKSTPVNGLFKKKEHFGTGVKLVNVFDIYRDNFLIDFESLERVEADKTEVEKYGVKPGDVFFVRSSLKLKGVGKSVCILDVAEPTVFECHVVKVRPDTDQILSAFLINYLNSTITMDRLVSLANTVTMTTLDQTKIKDVEVVIPPIKEQVMISEYLEQEYVNTNSLIGKVQEAITKLKEYRAALISAAVTGKIRVTEA